MELHGAFLFLLVALLIKGSKCIFDEEGPRFMEEPQSKLEFINEKGLQLNCTARGRPKPMITWATNDGSALFDVPGLRYVSTNGALIFNPFTAESFRPDVHSATYRCIASNSFGTVVSRDVRLRAVVKQSFEPEVHNVRAIKDFPVILQCVLPNFLRDFVTVTSWIYGSLNILPSSGFESEKYLMLDHGQLLIWQVSLQDSYSSYQCRTFHRFTEQTSVSAPAKLIVTEATEANRPVIQHKASSNVIVKENDRVVLPCIAYGHPRPSHKWLKREGSRFTPVIDDLSEDMRLSSRHTIDGNSVLIRHGALVFNSVRVPNKGTYVCNVTNAHGSDSVEIHLTVRSSLVVNLQPEKSTVDLGKNVELNCFASGEPPPTIQWMKDGRLLRPGNTAGRIRFIGQTRIQVVGVQREDQGVYQCMARNDYESLQRSAQVWLGDSPPKFLYRFIEQSLQPGPAISLKCSASGNPTPQISWLLDGFELPKSDRFLMGQYANVYGDVISHVNITSVQVEDGGQYECIATNRAGKEVHAAALNIYGSPFARAISDITAVAGKRFQFKCPIGGYPIEVISFEKDGKKLPSGRRQEVRDGSLLIESMERSDEGTYTCKAENKQGQSSQTSVKVRVIVPPKITPFSFPPWVRVNERTGIQCIISIGDPPFELTWIKDTVPLHSNTFTSMSTGDSSRKNTEISVPAPPSLLSSTHPKTNKNNNQQHESSNLNSIQHQKQQLLSWRDSNEAENPSTKIIIGHSEFSSYLNIPSITVEHMGNYTCLTKSLISGETASYTAQLTVNAAIKISKFTFEDGLIADRGMRTQVMCAATEGEPDKITWLRDNVELTSSLSVDDNNHKSLFTKLPSSSSPQQPSQSPTPPLSSSPAHPPGISIHRFGAFSSILTIVNVSSVHSANYKCILANRFGQTSHQASLIVRVPPKFTVEPKDEQITVGTQVLIDCQAEGTPMPRINWKQVVGPVEKKEYREVGYRTPGVLAAENGTLIISRVTEDHAGYYSCIASQPSSSSSSSSSSPAHQQQQHQHADMQTEISKLIHLLVNGPLLTIYTELLSPCSVFPPRIKARPPKEIVRRQETAILKCEVTGDEPLRISWFAKGIRLVDNVETRYSLLVGNKTSELTIKDVSSEDSGDFECVATNAYGQDQIWISLLVQGKFRL
ncbi:unnamed protein product [Allacma fusca]|uniref:Ig-like domain-containing protein n=1 Tax=Allacma fusca TaxID=39272 RepID=A0A8J2PNW5_9HEXA|nr:unnamed protein product [Allacma fusca]